VRTAFTDAEIAELRELPGVEAVSPIVSNRFSAEMTLDFGGARLGTELFFEAVPDAFLGDAPTEWHWKEGDRILPILLSRDFLSLYNLGFASSRGLPPVSEGMLGMVKAQAGMAGPGGSVELDARIVGLTDRLSSILVPESFMSWANTSLAMKTRSAARRLVVETLPSRGAALNAFLNARNWERMREGGAAAGILSMGRTALALAGAVGALLSVLAAALLAFSLSLAVERSRGPIGVLRLLGYSRTRLATLMGLSGGAAVFCASAVGAGLAVIAASTLRGVVTRTLGQDGNWGFPAAALLAAAGLAVFFASLPPMTGYALIRALEKKEKV
jgi:hypothetical protein